MDLSLLRSLFPYSVWDCWWLAPVALLLDLRLGDPALPWPHPVCFAGRLLGRLEGPARRWMRRGGAAGEKRRGRLAGLVCLFLLTGVSGLAAVSYTHLDVYKRQGQRAVPGRIARLRL